MGVGAVARCEVRNFVFGEMGEVEQRDLSNQISNRKIFIGMNGEKDGEMAIKTIGK